MTTEPTPQDDRTREANAVEDVFPVGRHELAALAGVSPSTIDTWRERHPSFPAPRWTVAGHPAWAWADAKAWLIATGRTGRLTDEGAGQ